MSHQQASQYAGIPCNNQFILVKHNKLNNSSGVHEYFTLVKKRVPHQCDYEPACPSQLQRAAAHAAGGEAGTVVGSEADTGVGTAACTGAEAEAEAGSEAAVWPPRGTRWRRPRKTWRSPGRCG